jgi:hypothetical protein
VIPKVRYDQSSLVLHAHPVRCHDLSLFVVFGAEDTNQVSCVAVDQKDHIRGWPASHDVMTKRVDTYAPWVLKHFFILSQLQRDRVDHSQTFGAAGIPHTYAVVAMVRDANSALQVRANIARQDELVLPLSLTAKGFDKVTLSIKDLDSVIPAVCNHHVTKMVQSHADGVVQLPRMTAISTLPHHEEKRAVFPKHLHTVVAVIHHNDMVRVRMHAHSLGLVEFAMLITQSTKVQQMFTLSIKVLDSVILRVGHDHSLVLLVKCYSPRIGELTRQHSLHAKYQHGPTQVGVSDFSGPTRCRKHGLPLPLLLFVVFLTVHSVSLISDCLRTRGREYRDRRHDR